MNAKRAKQLKRIASKLPRIILDATAQPVKHYDNLKDVYKKGGKLAVYHYCRLTTHFANENV